MALFQSPTSRGGLCNGNGARPSRSRFLDVSIPYFAGRPLQLGGIHDRPGFVQHMFQSPTSRGGLCNSDEGFRILLGRYQFQSPTSRGGLCNREDRGRVPADPPGGFQSPTSRGGLCNSCVMTCLSLIGTFQSPTSRGGLCNYITFLPRDTLKPRFNPLLRGAAFATRRAVGEAPGAGGSVSIPYFAGRPLQPPNSSIRHVRSTLVSIPYFAGRPLQRALGANLRRRP